MLRSSWQSVNQLLAEVPDAVQIERCIIGRSPIAVLAPHAGSIEPMTGDLAKAIAGHLHRFYGFSGRLVREQASLHINSLRFDEPQLHEVLRGARTAIAIHGLPGDEDAVTLIGGANRRLVEAIRSRLEAAGFAVMATSTRSDSDDPRNLVNRVPEGGVHLELTQRLRDDLRGGWLRRIRFEAYVAAIRAALAQEMNSPGPQWSEFNIQSATPAI